MEIKALIKEIINRAIIFIILFLTLVSVSVIGYMTVERWNFLDSLFMTVITISGIGYGEVRPLSDIGKIMTMFLILLGVGFYSSMIVYFSSLFLEGKIRKMLDVQSMETKIGSLNNHYIICGYGRIGREVAQNLKEKGIKFLIIEKDHEKIEYATQDGHIVYKGDATEDETLIGAGIARAEGIVCALTDDALNVFITLSAKVLNSKVNIIARADKAESIEKLKRAGAHNVIAPYIIGGKRIATAVTNPIVLDFLDTLLHDSSYDLNLEEVLVSYNSELSNTTIKKSNIRNKSGVIIIAIKKASGDLINNPSPEEYINNGDIIIVIGSSKQLEIINAMAQSKEK
ncbi:MAG: potassium channel protein [Candidatus Sericytochromatia bacterium]